jgi:hypothetical protein
MMRMFRRGLIVSLFSGWICLPICAQTAPDSSATEPAADQSEIVQPATQPDDTDVILAPTYSSRAYGLEFRPPANCVEIHRPTPDSIVEFDKDDVNWRLKAWRVRLDKPLPLTYHTDPSGQSLDGVLQIAVRNLRNSAPNAQVLRSDVINVGNYQVGMLAMRFESANQDRLLTQEAIVGAPDAGNRLYYFLEFTTPGKAAGEADNTPDPDEKSAEDIFARVVNTVKLLDRSDVANDQMQRLFQTRALFVGWDANNCQRVRAAIIPEQWQRVVKDDKEIGYTTIVEKIEEGNSPETSFLRIGIRSHIAPAADANWDTVSWLTCSLDRKHETWSTVATCKNDKGDEVDAVTQLATSDELTKAVALQPQVSPEGGLDSGDRGGPLGQGNVDIHTVRTLEVRTTHNTVPLDVFKQDVPAFYVPQAFSYLLPGLLPLDRAHAYMFACFVPNPTGAGRTVGGQVMARYVDVLPAAKIHFQGQEYQAAQIVDRVGLEGSPTNYYYTPDGKFLGSSSTYVQDSGQTTLTVIPSSAAELQRLWDNPDLTVPPTQGGADSASP